ncbi:MAG: DNRLRE domain-containing protein [Verrucomicrobiaceae bacterium]|nr:MAG: DNRLRE domain-containing protein [Verrucomicrobiaceae bacterium]
MDPAEDVLTGGAAVDFGMANHGQLKAIATRAYAQLAVEFPDIATATTQGAALAAYVGGFHAESGNYEPLLQGELKHAGKLFYDAIGAATGKGNIGYPWSKDAGMDRHASPATVGQVKMAFSFPQPLGGVIFNEPPSSVVITSPTQGQQLYAVLEKDITVQVAASDPDGNIDRVEFYEDGVLFATDTSAPYEAVYEDAPFGSYVFTAKAIDSRDLELTSSAVTVTVASGAPSSIALVGVTEGAHYLTYQAVPIQVEVSDPDNNIVKVEIWEGGHLLVQFMPPNMEPYQTMWVQPATGNYDLWARVYDADGQSLESERIHAVRDYNAPPVVTFSSPTQNQTYVLYQTMGKVDLTASAYDPDLHTMGGIGFYYTNTSVGGPMTLIANFPAPASTTNWTADMDWTPPSAGDYIIHARGYDLHGAPTTITRNIKVVAPTVVTLQEGVNGYTGMVDTELSWKGSPSGGDTTLRVRFTDTFFNKEAEVALMKWDLTGIPTNATVLEANMAVHVSSASSDPGSTSVYLLKTAWDESQANWEEKVTGTDWHGEGASGTNDVETNSIGWFDTDTAGWTSFAFTGTTAQSSLTKFKTWISTPSANHGVRLRATSAPHYCFISSSEAYDSSKRPKLTVTYWVP